MDVFAHVLWTNALFYLKYGQDRFNRYLGAFFGVLPDLLSFVPLVIYIIVTRLAFNPADYQFNSSWAFRFAAESYNFTHSFVIFLLLFFTVMVWRGKPFWPLLGWPLHIIIDIFTHPDFFQTPFLFPLSGVRNSHAIAWSHPIFMGINYVLILIVYIVIFRVIKPKYRLKSVAVPESAKIPNNSPSV